MPSMEYYNISEWHFGGLCNFGPDTERKEAPTALTNTQMCAKLWVQLEKIYFQRFCPKPTHCPMAPPPHTHAFTL